MDSNIFFLSDKKTNKIFIVINLDIEFRKIEFRKIELINVHSEYSDGDYKFYFKKNFYYYKEFDILDDMSNIENDYNRLLLGIDSDILNKMDKKVIKKKKNYIYLFEIENVHYISNDIYIFNNIDKIAEFFLKYPKVNIPIFTKYNNINIFNIWKKESNSSHNNLINYVIIDTNLLFDKYNSIHSDSNISNFIGKMVNISDSDKLQVNYEKKGQTVEIIEDDHEYFIFRDFITDENAKDTNKEPISKSHFSIYSRIYYIFSDQLYNSIEMFQSNLYLIRKCSLNKQKIDELFKAISFQGNVQFDNSLQKKISELNDDTYIDIFLYAQGVNKKEGDEEQTSTLILNNYDILHNICESSVCLIFTNVCNSLCANLDEYFVDILQNAKKLYEKGKCYQTYNDIHGAIFSYSNCASLFFTINTILKDNIKKEQNGTINKYFMSKDQELLEFYQNFDAKNEEVLICLKSLQEQFKSMNRSQKPDEDDVNTCVNIKNVVFSSKNQCIFFEDLIGLETAKEKIVNTFIMPIIYPSLYGKLSKGILLYGPPGTGKTYLVKAAINSLQRDYVNFNLSVLFFSPTPSDLKGKYVGESEKKIKELFNCANKKACECQDKLDNKMRYISVIFIDEIDNVGGSRSADETGMSKQTVNALLQAMDGIESHKNVIVMAATNNPWELDSALLRRFSNRLFIDLPDDKNIRTLIEKEIIDYIVNVSDYSDMCKKKHSSNEKETCLSVCNTKKKERNIYEELQKFNRKYNILPYNYENIIQNLSVQIRKKQLSNSDINQTLRISFSKMGFRTIQNELFINNINDSNNEYIGSISFKDTLTNVNQWNVKYPSQTNFLNYFFNGISPLNYYLSSFSEYNYAKFAKPYIKINNDIYLNIVYCVDRHPLLYLNFENIKAAYIKKECYESMVKLKQGENILNLGELSNCKILIEKDVEIVSEMQPILDKYKSNLPTKTLLEKSKEFLQFYGRLIIFMTPEIIKLFQLPFQSLENFVKTDSNLEIPNTIREKLMSAINEIKIYLGISSILEYFNNIPLKEIPCLLGLTTVIFSLISAFSKKISYNDCYNLFIIQYQPLLILYHIIWKMYQNLSKQENRELYDNFIQSNKIFYKEDFKTNTITFTAILLQNERILVKKSYTISSKEIDSYQNLWENIFNDNLSVNYNDCLAIIRKLEIENTDDYFKIFIDKNIDFKNNNLTNKNDFFYDLSNSETSENIQKSIIFSLLNNLQSNKSLSVSKTLYFECEIDLLHKFNKVWSNKIEYLRRTIYSIWGIVKQIFTFFFNLGKRIINYFKGGENVIIEPNSDYNNNEDIEKDFYKGINDIYKNITYLLLSNCNVFYYSDKTNTKFTRVLINAWRPTFDISDMTKFIDYINTNLNSLLVMLTANLALGINYINTILIYLLWWGLGDFFFNWFEIPPLRTITISNLLKQEKLFVSYDTFIKIYKNEDYSKIFNQTTSYFPLINYIDSLTGINRILYKVTKNTSLISLTNTFYKDRFNIFLEYIEFEIKKNKDNDILSLIYDGKITNIKGSIFPNIIDYPKLKNIFNDIINKIFMRKTKQNTIIKEALSINRDINLVEPENIIQLFVNYIQKNYRYENDNIISIETNSIIGKEFSHDQINEILHKITIGYDPTIQAETPLRYIFYTHVSSPFLRNYTIYFDIIEHDFEDKNSYINPNDYLDLIKYDKDPDTVIQNRLTKKQNPSKSFFSK